MCNYTYLHTWASFKVGEYFLPVGMIFWIMVAVFSSLIGSDSLVGWGVLGQSRISLLFL